jgi:hypothetical protein
MSRNPDYSLEIKKGKQREIIARLYDTSGENMPPIGNPRM